MLENREQLEGVDLSEVLQGMLQDLPWKALKSFVQSNNDLHKLCTLGGHRLTPKKRKRVEKLILKEAGKNDFSETFCNGIFAQWYPTLGALHKKLEDYFHSDDYEAYREEHDLDEDAYVLPDEKFEALFDVSDLEHWRALLCFSPMTFSEEQVERILEDSEGSADLIRRVRELEDLLDETKQENAQLTNELVGIREQHGQVNKEVQELRELRKDLTAERDGLEQKFDLSRQENRKLREEVERVGEELKKEHRERASELKREKHRLRNDLKRQDDELTGWRSKYEEQRAENRRLQEACEKAERELTHQKAIVAERNNQIEELHGFADLILSRIDWGELGKQLRLTPKLRRQFNSLIRKLNYEEDRTLTLDGTMSQFWERLMASEKDLVHHIAQSNTLEVMAGDPADYWQSLTDAFEDVHIGLEARSILLQMVHEIFYQVIEMEDLEAPQIPHGKE